MADSPYALLKDVTSEDQHWKIRVRIVRFWKFHDPNYLSKVIRHDFVMLDEKGDTMQGYIPKVFLNDFENALTEGHVYDIEYFQVEDAKNNFRAAHHPFQASFTAWTTVTLVDPTPQDFPLYGYKIRSFNQIIQEIDDKTHLADVIGMITGISNISAVEVKGHMTAKRTIRISDTRQNAMVTLWDGEAENLDVDMLRTMSQKQPVIALILGCTYKMHESMLSLSASYGAKLYINPADATVEAFRNRIHGGAYPIECITEKSRRMDSSQIIHTTINQLSTMNPHNIIGKRYRCIVVLEKIISTQYWWFISCDSCTRTAYPDGDAFRCSVCKNKTAAPRYKLAFRGSDGPIGVEILFFGDIGQQLIGRAVDDLVSESQTLAGQLPPAISAVIGRKYAVDVTVSRGSFKRREISFQVLRFYQEGSIEFIQLQRANDENPASSSTSLTPIPSEITTTKRDAQDEPVPSTPTNSEPLQETTLMLSTPPTVLENIGTIPPHTSTNSPENIGAPTNIKSTKSSKRPAQENLAHKTSRRLFTEGDHKHK